MGSITAGGGEEEVDPSDVFDLGIVTDA